MTCTAFVGQTLRVEFTVVDQDNAIVDLSTADTISLIFKKPNGSKDTKVASMVTDGTDGKMEYTTAVTDLDAAGLWKIQGLVTEAGGVYPTCIEELQVAARV